MPILSILGLLSAFLLIKLAGNTDILKDLTDLINQQTIGYQTAGYGDAIGLINLTTVVGAVIVFTFYCFKFNEWAGEGEAPKGFRPRPARHFTTWLRFHGWNTFYGSLMVGVYAMMVFFPEQIFSMLESFVTTSAKLETPLSAVSKMPKVISLLPGPDKISVYNPINAAEIAPYSVMLTTVIWAGVRPFSEFERRFRFRLQKRAAIPAAARALIETFEDEMDSFHPDPKIIKELLKEQGRIVGEDDFHDHGSHLWFLFARVQYLYHLLLKYNREPVFSRLAERYAYEITDIKANIAKMHMLLEKRIADINQLIQEQQTSHLDWESKDQKFQPDSLKDAEQFLAGRLASADKFKRIYFQRQEEELMDAIKKNSEDVVRLIVCSALVVSHSTQHTRDLLKEFGLKQSNRIPKQLDPVVVTLIAGGALAITFICSLGYYFISKNFADNPASHVPKDINGVLYWAVSSTLMHVSAMLGGYFSQKRLEIGRARLQIGEMKEMPLSARAQIAQGLWAACIGFSINVFLLGAMAAYGGSFPRLGTMWWWALVPSVTAYFSAIYTQRIKRSKWELNALMWAQGLATGLTAIIVSYLLYSGQTSPVSKYFIGYLTITTIILGIAISSILQHWVKGIEMPEGPEKRKDKRWEPFFMRAKWRSAKGEPLPARVLNFSSSGAALKIKTPLEDETEGEVEFAGKENQSAKVVRKDEDDPRRIYVQFHRTTA